MSNALEEFLALRQASGTTLPAEDPKAGGIEGDLAAYFLDLLIAYSTPQPVKNRQDLANYLARRSAWCDPGPQGAALTGQGRLRLVPRDELWVTQCPVGHLTREVIESHQVLGWVCSACQKVYDTGECRLIRRQSKVTELRVGELE